MDLGPLGLLFVSFWWFLAAKRAFSKKCSWCGRGHDFGGLGGFLAALGSLFGRLGWLLGSLLVSPSIHPRTWRNLPPFSLHSFFPTLNLS